MNKWEIKETSGDMKWEIDGLHLAALRDLIVKWIGQYGPLATLNIDYSDYCTIDITTLRQETDEEYNYRIAQEAGRAARQEALERAQYEALKKKFGG